MKTARWCRDLSVNYAVGRGLWAAQGRGFASNCGLRSVLASPGPSCLMLGPNAGEAKHCLVSLDTLPGVSAAPGQDKNLALALSKAMDAT